MKQRIEINASGKALLAEKFKVSVQNVSQALLFRRNSLQAQRIREEALICGGKMVEIRHVAQSRAKGLLRSCGAGESNVNEKEF